MKKAKRRKKAVFRSGSAGRVNHKPPTKNTVSRFYSFKSNYKNYFDYNFKVKKDKEMPFMKISSG